MKFMKAGSQHSDVVYTPVPLAQRLVEHFNPTGRVLDACRGGGAFDHPSVTDWCEIAEGRDFLKCNESWDWIISNPPWSEFNLFNRHALAHSDNVVWLYHLPGLLTNRRLRDGDKQHWLREIILIDAPPPPWPQSGFQVAAAWWSKTEGPMQWTDWRKKNV
jgi:hypothetical protein